MNGHNNDDKLKALDLFVSLRQLFLENIDTANNSGLITTLNVAITKTKNNSQTPKLEARSVFTNISRYCLVDKIHLTKSEAKILSDINHFSQSGGIWGGLNTWNVTNMWPSN